MAPKLDTLGEFAKSIAYERDWLDWLDQTIAQLHQQDYDQVDWANLIEELEDLSRRQRETLESHVIVIVRHLLKWQFQPNQQSGSWKSSIREYRRRVNKSLTNSPSLRLYLDSIFSSAYLEARAQAADETGLMIATFPPTCPYALQEVLDAEWLPTTTESLQMAE